MRFDKRFVRLTATVFLVAAAVCACTSREDKVADLIKDDMFKNLYDFESYQPIETKIDSLKHDKYGDTLIFDNVMLAYEVNKDFDKAANNFDEQERLAEVYFPSYYSSSLSDRKFNKSRSKMQEYLDEMKMYNMTLDSLQMLIRTLVKQCDGSQYGWLVTHKFRCKTKGGGSTIGTYYYFMDNDCEKYYRRLDEADMSFEQYKEWVDGAITQPTNKERELKEKREN